jgi:iron-sulfur cluster assembly accessory protein
MHLRKLYGFKVLQPRCSRANFSQLDEDVLHLTDSVKKRLSLLRTLENQQEASDSLIRIVVDSGGCKGYMVKFELDSANALSEDDYAFSCPTGRPGEEKLLRPRLVIDNLSLDKLKGATIDYVNEIARQAFVVANNPQASSSCGCKVSFNIE